MCGLAPSELLLPTGPDFGNRFRRQNEKAEERGSFFTDLSCSDLETTAGSCPGQGY